MAEAAGILSGARGQRPTKYGALTRGSQPFQKFSIHKLRPNDTLTSVAVKYGVTVEELKRANSLWTSEICTRSELKVPVKSGPLFSEPDCSEGTSESASNDGQHTRRERSRTREHKPTQAPDTNVNHSDVSPDDFFKKFDVKILKIKGSVEKIESESSYSEEDGINNSGANKRGRYYRTHRQGSKSFFASSTDEDVMTAPELFVKDSSQLLESRDMVLPSDEQFFSL